MTGLGKVAVLVELVVPGSSEYPRIIGMKIPGNNLRLVLFHFPDDIQRLEPSVGVGGGVAMFDLASNDVEIIVHPHFYL